MRNFNNLSKIVYLTVILLTAYTFEVFAQTPRQTPQEKRQQLEQEASGASNELSTQYQEILKYVNSAQMPPELNLETALKAVAKNRKYLLVFDNLQKSTYHVFSAWVYYFDNKQDKAIKQAVSGQKVFPDNSNTVKTRFALSMIYKDYTSAIEAITEQSTGNRSARPTNNAEPQSYQQPTDDIQLDINAVRIELLGKPFDFHPAPAEVNSTYPWQSAGRLACTLLWKIDANEFNRFAPVAPKAETNEPNLPANTEEAESVAAQTGLGLYGETSQQMQARELGEFSQLQDMLGKDKRAVFAAINLNNLEKRKYLENWLAKNPQNWKTFLLSSEGQQKIASLLGDSNKPMLLVVGPDSTIRYAGDVNGFLPQMIIQNILQNPLEFASVDYNEPNQPSVVSIPNLPAIIESAQPVILSAESSAETNTTPALTADTTKTDVNTQKPQTDINSVSATVIPQQSDDILAAADDYQAEKLLSNAKTFLQIGNKLPSHMYRDPVEWCRKVMKDYPNTKYAQEAQILLRNVPKEHREQYNITDEELGL